MAFQLATAHSTILRDLRLSEAIGISLPVAGMQVPSPATVSGSLATFTQWVVLRVLDATGFEIGTNYVRMEPPANGHGLSFQGQVTYAVPAERQPGRIQAYTLGPQDGAIEHLTSVEVILPGAGLSQAIESLAAALQDEDYDALQELMAPAWRLTTGSTQSWLMSPVQAIQHLRGDHLGPGQVVVDLSVDARVLLGDRSARDPDVYHVLFSSGWGAGAGRHALLIMGLNEANQARWSGLHYLPDSA